MISNRDQYADLGVDAGKSNVREAFGSVIDNMLPHAFVNIVLDPMAPQGMMLTQHGDGDGSKPIQRLLYFLETGDRSVFAGAVDDAVSMNTGDIAASGFVGTDNEGCQVWTDNLNIRDMPEINFKETVMNVFAERFRELRDLYQQQGFSVLFMGGETADLPDQVMTSVFDVTVNAREHLKNIIAGNVRPGDVIYGFASNGQAAWEDRPNSGIMSNGLTLAGTCLGSERYNSMYPFLRLKNPFTGRFKVGDTDPLLGDMTVFEALLSPTRQWAFLIRLLVAELKERDCLGMLHGISMNTGGGATKIGHVGTGIKYRKEMPEPPPIFQLIQREGVVSWQEMFKNFNCGIGLDVVGADHNDFHDAVNLVAQQANVDFYRLGFTERFEGGGNKIVLETPYGDFDY